MMEPPYPGARILLSVRRAVACRGDIFSSRSPGRSKAGQPWNMTVRQITRTPIFENRPCARASQSRCQPHRKRESQHHVIG